MAFGGDDGWPEVEDLKRRLDVLDTSVHDGEMAVILAAAIEQVKIEQGAWADSDAPNDNLAEAALMRAVEIASDTPLPPKNERRSTQLMYGQRQRFPIS